jgi:hypothetical protein
MLAWDHITDEWASAKLTDAEVERLKRQADLLPRTLVLKRAVFEGDRHAGEREAWVDAARCLCDGSSLSLSRETLRSCSFVCTIGDYLLRRTVFTPIESWDLIQ